jgi:glycosyltransferase involved in cell wall biosynthesis
MKVLIDAGKLKDLYSGLGQVSHDMGIALAQLANTDHQFTFIVPSGQEGVFGNHVHYIKDRFFNRLLLKFTAAAKFDLLHFPHQDFHDWLRPKNLPYLVTVHDLNFLYTKTEQKANKYLHRLQNKLKEAKVIVAISKFTAGEVKQHVDIGAIPLQVIYNGVRSIADSSVAAEQMNIAQPFLFTIGVMHPKKNFEALIKMMQAIPVYTLVIAGGGNDLYMNELKQLADKMGIAGRIEFTGYVTPGEKKWLYTNCSAFLFASVSEGFGLPVIEAMQFGKPVFLNHKTSLPEIGGAYATYWHNADTVTMSKVFQEGMQQYADKPELQNEMKLYAAGFSWNKNASEYVLLYQSILNGQPAGTNL